MVDSVEIPVITSEQLGAFHRAKGLKNAACLRCGNVSWSLLSSTEAPVSGLPTAKTEERAEVDLFTPILTLTCRNCGTLWFVAAQSVLDWLTETREQGASGDAG
ncbi:hypothetical protein [Dyella thiooxydans]|uniref:hypothetical protein n=1 Tax=Dyella thiooxydans TaxID=445710 RepID=UPI0012FB3F33|nr:hypothetical protein [Dyella thiooxydans]